MSPTTDDIVANTTHRFNYRLSERIAERAAIGVLALTTDATLESEWRQLLAIDGVSFYVGRINNEVTINHRTLAAMKDELATAASALLPDCELDIMVFACTSASLVIGENTVQQLLRTARPGIQATTPLTAAKAAFSQLGMKRIALLTPYIDEINLPMKKHLQEHGFEVKTMGSFFNDLDPEVARISPQSIAEALRKLAGDAVVDGAFIACTGLRASLLVDSLESELGIPVTTSNHAMAWHALKLAGIKPQMAGKGRLFSGKELP